MSDSTDNPAAFSLAMLAVAAMLVVACVCWWLRPDEVDLAGGPIDTGYRVHLNTADADTLELLPGVGPTVARHIVEHRQSHGPFTDVSQLTDVNMIGPVVSSRIAPWVALENVQPDEASAVTPPTASARDAVDAAPR